MRDPISSSGYSSYPMLCSSILDDTMILYQNTFEHSAFKQNKTPCLPSEAICQACMHAAGAVATAPPTAYRQPTTGSPQKCQAWDAALHPFVAMRAASAFPDAG